jgi:hypothetical protein
MRDVLNVANRHFWISNEKRKIQASLLSVK